MLIEAPLTAVITTTLESPWLEREPIQIGEVPVGHFAPDRYVLVRSVNNGVETPVARIDVYGFSDERFVCEEVAAWHEWVVIGFGFRVYLVAPLDGRHTVLDLSDYFGGLYPGVDWLLAASAQRLFKLDRDGSLVWVSAPLAADGIVVDGVTGPYIHGHGEWSARGAWESFHVRLETGEKA